MAEKKFRVVCYCRVATKNQNDDSPLEAQSVYLRRYAKDLSLIHIFIFDHRPKLSVTPRRLY